MIRNKISILLMVTVILLALTGCSAVEKQKPGISKNEQGNAMTVRIENQSAVNLYGIAVSYSANGEILGSKACERIDKNAEQAVYEFYFVPDELSAAPIDTFQLEVFAAEKAGEDYSDCGSALINSPQAGAIYSLALTGEAATTLTLSTAERDVEIFTSVQAAQTELSADTLAGS